MKLFHYFLGFNAFALAYWILNFLMSDLDVTTDWYIGSCLFFSVLASVGIYNIKEGLKKQNNDWL